MTDTHIPTKVLITGATGKLGRFLHSRISSETECVSLGYKNSIENCINVNLVNNVEVNEILNETRPKIIIHTAALTNVDECEKNPKLAYDTNVLITKNLIEWVVQNSADTKFIYISTDHVYDEEGLSEENSINPVNIYALTKLWGEDIVRTHTNHLIVRTNFIDLKINGIVNWILESIRKKKEIFIFDDVFFNPIYLPQLIDLLVLFSKNEITGTYNVGASGDGMSKAEFAEKIAHVFELDKNYFKHCNSSDIDFLTAPRPKDMRMNISKLKNDCRYDVSSLEESIISMKESID